MATFTYILRIGKNESASIILKFSYGRKKLFRVSTGFKVKNKNNFKDEQIKLITAEPKATAINKSLRELKTHFLNGYDELTTLGEAIDNNILKELFDNFNNSAKSTLKKESFDIIKLADKWLYFSEFEKRNKKGLKLSKGTIKTYKNTKEVLIKFNKKHKIIRAKDINLNTYNKLLNFLESQKYSLNYTGKVIKILKTFFNYINKDLKINLPEYNSTDWEVRKEEIDEIYLSNKELMKIYYLNLDHLKKNYSIARDLFLISAFTGLRISDNKRLESDSIINMEGYKFFRIHSQKTDSESIIPISPIVEDIIKRNDGLPPSIAEQTINKLIKEIGEFAGIDEVVKIKKTIGGKVKETKHFKFDLIKTHTARRSFCTNAYLGGMDTLSIMAVSGHTSEKNFQTYIKVTKKQQALRNAKNEYFNTLNTEHYKEEQQQLKIV